MFRWKTMSTGSKVLILFLLGLMTSLLTAQQPQVQEQQKTTEVKQTKEIPLDHLYWHFLMLQNHLDRRGDELEQEGKDGKRTRRNLQDGLGFSDDEFASIRSSSLRLATAIKGLDERAVVIRSGSAPAESKLTQIKGLVAERETAIQAEVKALHQSLSPEKMQALESYVRRLFSSEATVKIGGSARGQSSPAGATSPSGVQR